MRKLIFIFMVVLMAAPAAFALEALPAHPPIPSGNAMSVAKVHLGKQLYFDKRLSSDGTISCQSCHNVMGSGADAFTKSVSTGVGGHHGTRNAPTVWNAAYLSTQFWDGRAPSLEEQAKGPLLNPVEMGNKNGKVVAARLQKIPGYRKEFKKVFGHKEITFENVVKAISAYERTLVTPNSAFDRYEKGDKKALSHKARQGLALVQKIGCTSCHMGPDFAGPQMPQGTGFFMKFPRYPGSKYDRKYHLTKDLGRYTATKNKADKHMWRVPSWRNVALTAPYFHNGSVKTLNVAVRVMARDQLDKKLTNRQVSQIVAFLHSLTGRRPHESMPKLPR